MRRKLLALLAAMLGCAAGGALQAANLIVNGGFEQLYHTGTMNDYGRSTVVGSFNQNVDLYGWDTGGGFNFVFLGSGTTSYAHSNAPGAYNGPGVGNEFLYGPSTGFNNGFTNSYNQGNIFGADGGYLNAPISQQISGLTVGREYSLSFEWAAAQLYGFDGATDDYWKICFGTCAYTATYDGNGFGHASYIPDADNQYYQTITRDVAEWGFVPWQSEYVVFTATSSTMTLSLLSHGTPASMPPFALIDGLYMDAVPEPTTWAMMLIGFGVIGGIMRTRNRPLDGRRALTRQIV